jgi:hypothetical protein
MGWHDGCHESKRVMELEAPSSKYTVDHSHIDAEDKIISPFEPDTAQYLATLRRKTLIEPENRLILAALEDAINCFHVYVTAQTGRGKRLFDEAEEWIMMKHDDWIFSFVSICEMLGLSPEYVRRGLRRWKQGMSAPNFLSGPLFTFFGLTRVRTLSKSRHAYGV